jgi:hypothetical protein
LGLAYDNELGGRMWLGAVDRRVLDLALEGSAALFLGELRKELYAGFRRNYQLGRQLMTPTLTVRLATESVRRFDSAGEELGSLETREALGFLGLERSFGGGWQLAIGSIGHSWREPGREQSTVGALARVEKAAGRGRAVGAELLWTALYSRAAVEAETWIRAGRFRLRPRAQLGWGERLPIQASFPLGGEDGFPGLHLGEDRGDRETLINLMATYPLRGPFVGRLELAAGRTALGGALFGDQRWRVGVRAGLGAETPVGPVRIEYGVANGGRGAAFVRIGSWF